MHRLIAAVVFVSLPVAAVLVHAQRQRAPAAVSTSGLELALMDRSADPCVDFYAYACGGWTAGQPIPADRSTWGVAQRLQEQNEERLRRILEKAAARPDPETQKIGDYFASCMDEAGIEAKGRAALDGPLAKIAALSDVTGLADLLAELHPIGVNAFFGFGAEADFKEAAVVRAIVDQGGLGLPDRDYYFREDAKSSELRQQYVDHVKRMLELLGQTADEAAAGAQSVMRLETALAKNALDAVARRDPSRIYHRTTASELASLTPRFDWKRYFAGVNAPAIDVLNVTEPDFFRGMEDIVSSTPVADVRTYLGWHLAHASARALPAAFVNEDFRFYGTTLTGAKQLRDRWKRCVQYTDRDLGEALGKAFVAEAFKPAAKAETLKMVGAIEAALERDISELGWMTDETKKQALVKLHAITNKIGYPDKWRDYSALSIVRGDALGNAHRSSAFEFRRQIGRIGKPLDKSQWDVTPPTVDAYYNPLQNNINFPAGILQPPFYSADADAAVNYGGAGAAIGHELTHGFDDEGRQFDAAGNLKDWWTADDAKAFDERAQCFVDQYSKYTAVDDVNVNGKLTLGENAADNGGTRIALMAYMASLTPADNRTLDGYTPEQRFFIAYGQSWCENTRPERERLRAQTNPHSPSRYRVTGVVTNMPEFRKAFSCKGDAPMVGRTVCRVW
jgi:endothelin-converting enzyme/putative endopeptidase